MNQGDIEAIMRGISPVLAGVIKDAMQPLVHRILTLEAREPLQGETGDTGQDGKDGADGKDGTGTRGDAGEPGNDGQDGKDAYPGEAKGLFDPEAPYRAMDVVSFNGSEWRAKQDEPGPLPGDGWMLSAQRGKRGGNGDRGEKGGSGLDGKDGAQPIALSFDAEEMKFVTVLDSGEILEADFAPIARAIRGE